MAYSTLTDLTRWIEEDELVALCTRDPEATAESDSVTAVAGEAIESADAEIDSYLLGRWPGLHSWSPVPDELNRLSSMIAVYNLYLRRRAVSEPWRRNYEDCLAKLKQASEGKLSLGLDDQGTRASSGSEACRTDADDSTRVYNDDLLSRF